MSARLYQLPGAPLEPVNNPRWRGRYPRGVACFNAERYRRNVPEPKAQHIPSASVEAGDGEVSELEALREQVEALAKTALRLGVEIIRLQQQ